MSLRSLGVLRKRRSASSLHDTVSRERIKAQSDHLNKYLDDTRRKRVASIEIFDKVFEAVFERVGIGE